DELALHFAAINARRAGFTEFTTQALDLRSPPSDLKFHVILCADLLYETYMIEMVINFMKNVLAPGGVCMLTDPDRVSAQSFEETACSAGLCVER
ncbi:methyltransferase domain-containing protein, partial [Acinetobacter baumannii]